MLNKIKHIISVFNSKMGVISKKIEIKNPIIKKILPTFLFLIFLHIFYSYVGLYNYLDKRPCSVHSSAQCQRASVALNYYETDMNFFTPRVQKSLQEDAITGLEFPIIYYTAAVLYKLFGFNEVYLKVISLLLFTIGLVFFNLLVLKFIKNYILSIAIVSCVICSPVLLYYTPNFMPDVPSLALILSAWYFFFKYIETNFYKYLFFFVLAGTLAMLLKITAVICFMVVICLVVLDYLSFFKNSERKELFLFKKKLLLNISVGFIAIFGWYYYASWLTKAHHNDTFSLSPVIVNNLSDAKLIWEAVKVNMIFEYYAYETYVLMLVVLCVMVIGFKYLNKLLATITILNILGSLCFIYFFLNQFKYHDYYIILLLSNVFLLFLTFADFIRTVSVKYTPIIQFILIIAIFFNVKECLVWSEKMYNQRFNDYSINFHGNYRPYEDLEAKLRSLGVKRNDRTLFAFDNSFCNELYLSNQLGYSFDSSITKSELDKLMDNSNYKYLVVNDSTVFNKIYSKNIDSKIIATHRSLIIYKLAR